MSELAFNPYTSWMPRLYANFSSRAVTRIGTFAGTVSEGDFYIRGTFASGMETYPLMWGH